MSDASSGESRQPVTLAEVAKAVGGKMSGDERVVITDVTHDSRQAKLGSLFVAIRGELFDAHKFVPQVLAQGAVGVLSEMERPDDFNAAWIQVPDVRRAMALAFRSARSSTSRIGFLCADVSGIWLGITRKGILSFLSN